MTDSKKLTIFIGGVVFTALVGLVLPRLYFTPSAERFDGEEAVFALKVNEVMQQRLNADSPIKRILTTGYSISGITRDINDKDCTIKFDADGSEFHLWWGHSASITIRGPFGIPLERTEYSCQK